MMSWSSEEFAHSEMGHYDSLHCHITNDVVQSGYYSNIAMK